MLCVRYARETFSFFGFLFCWVGAWDIVDMQIFEDSLVRNLFYISVSVFLGFIFGYALSIESLYYIAAADKEYSLENEEQFPLVDDSKCDEHKLQHLEQVIHRQLLGADSTTVDGFSSGDSFDMSPLSVSLPATIPEVQTRESPPPMQKSLSLPEKPAENALQQQDQGTTRTRPKNFPRNRAGNEIIRSYSVVLPQRYHSTSATETFKTRSKSLIIPKVQPQSIAQARPVRTTQQLVQLYQHQLHRRRQQRRSMMNKSCDTSVSHQQ